MSSYEIWRQAGWIYILPHWCINFGLSILLGLFRYGLRTSTGGLSGVPFQEGKHHCMQRLLFGVK